MVNLAQRAEIVKRMDNQFNQNLEMRRSLHALDQRAKNIYSNCKLFQKVRLIPCPQRPGRPLRTLRTVSPDWTITDNFRNFKTTTTMFSN